jgi:hypothetical protein
VDGYRHAVTASTEQPVNRAWRIAQRNAAFDDSEPSTPTTIRFSCAVIIAPFHVGSAGS